MTAWGTVGILGSGDTLAGQVTGQHGVTAAAEQYGATQRWLLAGALALVVNIPSVGGSASPPELLGFSIHREFGCNAAPFSQGIHLEPRQVGQRSRAVLTLFTVDAAMQYGWPCGLVGYGIKADFLAVGRRCMMVN